MKSRKFLSILLIVLLIVGTMTACGDSNKENKDNNQANNQTQNDNKSNDGNKEKDNSKDDEKNKYGGTFVWAQSSDPNTLLYAWIPSGWTNRMSSFINDKLFVFDQNGEIVYRICDKYTVSDDGLLYTFHVRDGVKWHDGTPVLASDIVWTRNVQYDENWFMALQNEIPGEWNVVDDQTFTIQLDEPTPTFLYTLSDLMYPQPEHYWADVDPANFFSCEKATKPMGCGPFKFVEYKVGDYLKMEAFDDFWNGRPYLDQAYIKITGGGDATQVGFEAGEISALQTTELYYDEIKDNPKYQFYIGPSTNLCEINIDGILYKNKDTNQEKPLYTGDVNIRKALCYAVPYEDIIDKILRKACTRSYSMVPSDCQFFTEDGINKYEYNIDKANQILDEAGYKDTNGDGFREWKDGSTISILWSYFEAGGVNEQMSILMAEQCQKIGIASGLKTTEKTTWVDTLLAPKEFDIDNVATEAYIYYYGGYGGLAYDYENMFSSTGGQSAFINWDTGETYPQADKERMFEKELLANQEKIDALFAKMHTNDEQVAKEAFEEIQRIITNDLVTIIPVGTMEKRMAFQANIRGLEDAVWLTNNNYLGFAMEKIWIEK